MGELLWQKKYKYWKLYYVDGSSFFAYKSEKEYLKDQELRFLTIIDTHSYADLTRLKPCDEFERLKQLGLIDIRWHDRRGYLVRYCYFDVKWEPYGQVPPLILARTLIDGLGLTAFNVSIFDEWSDYLSRFDVTRWTWDALKVVMKSVPAEELPEFLIHQCPPIQQLAGEAIDNWRATA